MSDFKLPELPSDEELGITEEDRRKYADELPDDGPELSAAEMAALLGDSPKPKGAPSPSKSDAKARAKAEKQAEKARTKAEKQARKARAKEAKRLAREAKGTAKPAEPRSAPGVAGTKAGDTGRSKETAPAAGKGGPETPAAAAPTTATTGAPGAAWRGPVTLVLLLATAVYASTRTGLPRPVPANAPDTAFSSSRAMSSLVEMARIPHPTGSPEHARVRDFLVERLTTMGLEPEIQTATSLVEQPGAARAATVRNVVATVHGQAPTGTVLITAHYDSRALSVGAADDGSGVVTILEAVRALRAGPPPRNDIVVLFTDAEELGLLGARAFAAEHPLMDEVDLALSFEMRGAGGPSIMFETAPLNGWVVRTMKEWDTRPFANSMAHEVYERMPNGTDFTVFAEAGVQGLNYAAIDNAHVYHQVYDEPDNLSEATLQHHGLHALGALRYYGDADLGAVNAEDVVYFTLPGLGLIVYSKRWALPLSGLLLLLGAGLAVAARRGGARLGAAAVGLVVASLCGAVVYVAAAAGVGWLDGLHEEAGSLAGSVYHREGWYLVALACTSLAVVTAVTSIARRWLTLVELTLGALVLPLLAAVALGAAAPLAAMNLQWPVAAALVAGLVVALLGARAEGTVGWIATVLLAIPVVAFFQPLVELVWMALTLRMMGAIAVLVVTGLLLCLPALSALRYPNAWWAPASAAGVAAIALGVGVLASRPSGDRPAPSTLVYAYEHGTGDAVWATTPERRADDAEARAWAVERAGGAFDASRDLSAFGYRAGEVPVAPARVVSAEPPTVDIVGDTVFQGRRRVVMSVRSRIGAESIQFHMDPRTRLHALNGVAISDPEGLRRAEHWGEPETAVLLELSMPPDAPIGVHVVEHLLRPEELFGSGRFARPPGLAPDDSRMSDRAMLRFSVAALADPKHAVGLPSNDTTAAPLDSAVAAPDTISLPPDTATAPDTTSVPRDTSAAPADTSGAVARGRGEA